METITLILAILIIISLLLYNWKLRQEKLFLETRIKVLNHSVLNKTERILQNKGNTFKLYELLGFDSQKHIGRVQERFDELSHKGWDWRSFYNGWSEGRADMMIIDIEKKQLDKLASNMPVYENPPKPPERNVKVIIDVPPKHEKTYPVRFDENDENGITKGTINNIQIGNMMLEYICFQGQSFISDIPNESIFKIESGSDYLSFQAINYKEHIGNLCWNSYELNKYDVLRLINFLKTENWSIQEAPTKQYYKFQNGIAFVESDLIDLYE